MNLTYSNKLLSILIFLFLGVSAQVSAQEDRAGEYDQTVKQQQPVRELTREGDSYSYPESSTDGRISGAPVSNKDSVPSRDTAASNATNAEPEIILTNKSSEKKVQKEADESVLSFNFLYYIIQRFKLSDIIE